MNSKGWADLSKHKGAESVQEIKSTEECQLRHLMHHSNMKFIHEYTQAKSQRGFTWLDLAFHPSTVSLKTFSLKASTLFFHCFPFSFLRLWNAWLTSTSKSGQRAHFNTGALSLTQTDIDREKHIKRQTERHTRNQGPKLTSSMWQTPLWIGFGEYLSYLEPQQWANTGNLGDFCSFDVSIWYCVTCQQCTSKNSTFFLQWQLKTCMCSFSSVENLLTPCGIYMWKTHVKIKKLWGTQSCVFMKFPFFFFQTSSSLLWCWPAMLITNMQQNV